MLVTWLKMAHCKEAEPSDLIHKIGLTKTDWKVTLYSFPDRPQRLCKPGKENILSHFSRKSSYAQMACQACLRHQGERKKQNPSS